MTKTHKIYDHPDVAECNNLHCNRTYKSLMDIAGTNIDHTLEDFMGKMEIAGASRPKQIAAAISIACGTLNVILMRAFERQDFRSLLLTALFISYCWGVRKERRH